jgi:LysR family transcriptional regulator, glycine cleavage system transcriptional activator
MPSAEDWPCQTNWEDATNSGALSLYLLLSKKNAGSNAYVHGLAVLNSMSPSMLVWLRSFEAAARLGSITRAAEELCISQGAVSQQVRQLEKALGFPLLVRQPNGLGLTPEGFKLAPVAQKAFASLRDIVAEISSPGGIVPITLSCSTSFALQWLTPRLKGLQNRQPNVDLRVFGEFHDLNRIRMSADQIEAAIRYDLGDYEDLRAHVLLDEYLIAVASPDYLRRSPPIFPDSELEGHLLLHDSRPWAGAADDVEWRQFLAGTGLSIKNVTHGKRFNLSQLAIGAALAGEGIAIGRLATVSEELQSGRLVPILPIAVRSIASYHFISVDERPAKISGVYRWLLEESAEFRRKRDKLLRGFSIIEVRS